MNDMTTSISRIIADLPKSQIYYDSLSDQWCLRIPTGAFMMFDRHDSRNIPIETGLISFEEANNLCWKVFGAGVESVMGPYSELSLDKEGYHGWGSLPVPKSPTPPPPSSYTESIKKPRARAKESLRHGFGMTSRAGGVISLLPMKTVRPIKVKKRSKKIKPVVDDSDCYSCSF